jgi:hypothetical protein
MNQGIKRLIADTAAVCVANKIELRITNTHAVNADNIITSGYFDDASLVVAGGKRDWVDVLAHESCHMDQFLEKDLIYMTSDNSLSAIDDWLAGKEFSNTNLIQKFIDVIVMELDCEKRTVKKLKKYKIYPNMENYIKQVNAYLFGYWATFRDRVWCPFPYNNKKIVNKMPGKFLPIKAYCNPLTEYLQYFPNEVRKTTKDRRASKLSV